MVWQYAPYIWLPITSAGISAALGAWAWRRRTVRGAWPFVASLLVSVIWSLTYALQLASADLTSAFLRPLVMLTGLLGIIQWNGFYNRPECRVRYERDLAQYDEREPQ